MITFSAGSSREAYLQQEIQEGQKLRLRSVQDDLLMCLRKQEDIDQTINKLNEVILVILFYMFALYSRVFARKYARYYTTVALLVVD